MTVHDARSLRSISHDVRNLLATVRLATETLEAVAHPGVPQTGRRIQSLIDRAVEILADGCAHGPGRPVHEIGLGTLMADLCDDVHLATGRTVTMVHETDAVAWMPLPATRFYRMIYNVALNGALAAARPGAGTVVIRAQADVGRLTVDVIDDGPGFSSRIATHLPGADCPRWSAESGVGLMTAGRLARDMGGELAIAETGPLGTRIRITLPIEPPLALPVDPPERTGRSSRSRQDRHAE